jgi:2-isopropylmalate synthase
MTIQDNADPRKDRVVIFDTTLRDGEQSPGASMTTEEKLQVAELLDEMGVDIIEAGFPIASQGDFEAVQEIARRTERSVVAGLARAITGDIPRPREAGGGGPRPRLHNFFLY